MGKVYAKQISVCVCDSCGVRFNVAVEWDYTQDKALPASLPSCGVCSRVMRWDRELYQHALDDQFEEEVEVARARRIETIWRERREKIRVRRERAFAARARARDGVPKPPREPKVAPKPDLKLAIVNRMRYLRDHIIGNWDRRCQERDQLRPDNAGEQRLAPLFRLIRHERRAMWLWDGLLASEYWRVQDGYIDPEAKDIGTVAILQLLEARVDLDTDTYIGATVREYWTVAPSGRRQLDEREIRRVIMFEDWYSSPNHYNPPGFRFRRNLKGLLSERDIETLIEQGGKALGGKVWNYLCGLFISRRADYQYKYT